MRNFSKYILFTLAVAFVFGAIAVNETVAQGTVNEILKRMEAHSKALSSLKANITSSEHDSTLDDYDTKAGTLHYLPGKGRNVFARIEWKKPAHEILVVARGDFVLYTPGIKQAIKGKTATASKSSRGSDTFDFMKMKSKAEFKAKYSIVYLGVEKVRGKEMWRLRLNPKQRKSYKHAELWVDGNGMPIQTKTVQRYGDSTTFLLEDIEKNVTIPGKIFSVNLPKGTKIVKG